MKHLIKEAMNSRDKLVKEQVISMLISEGYGTYAKRLKEFDFIVAHVYNRAYIEVAAMFPSTGEIVINPAFLADEKTFSQLSLVVRHELLHFLLVHEKRLFDHLKATDPEFEKTYRKASIHELANLAMDWELSDLGYDDHDKKVAKNLTLNGKVLGGLVLESDHPEWVGKPMEEIFTLLRKEHEERLKANNTTKGPKQKVTIKKATHTQEYRDAYNKIMKKYDDPSFSDKDLANLILDLEAGVEISLD